MKKRQTHKGFKNLFLVPWIRRWIAGLAGFILFLSLSGLPSLAQAPLDFPPSKPRQQEPVRREPLVLPPTSPTGPALDDPQEFQKFVDNFFNEEMSNTHIPGAAISVVKNGKLFFAKGYGYANLEKKIPVEADKTLFRIASLSKLFTATAAMQLYERGLLDLDGDVSKYLPFDLENPFPEPVTPARMMMHTDGTTKRRLGLAAPTEAKMEPLGDYLADHMPPVVWPPGELYSYSSHSIALLGYVVERASGIPFIKYVDENIFQPLEMQRSTFLQPPPPPLLNDLAVGYQYNNGEFHSVPFLYLNIYPGAAMSATATDMAKYMIDQLLHGSLKSSRILKADTVRLMHEQHFTHHPLLPGTGYSFRERLENNIRMVGHLGSLRGYSSSLTLMPDQDIGIFIASNSFGGIHSKFLTQFLDRYFPAPAERLPAVKLTDAQLERFTGSYRDLEYPRDTFLKIIAPFERINIKKGDNGTLLISTPSLFFLGNAPKYQLVPVGEMVFQRAKDDAFTAFGEDGGGEIAYAFNPLWPKIGAYEKVPWYEGIWVQLGIIAFCVVFFLAAAIMWPIRPLIRRLRGKPAQVEREFKNAWIIAGIVGTLYLVFLIGFALSLWLVGWKLVYGVPIFIAALFCLPLLATAMTPVLIFFAGLAWVDKNWSLLKRSLYSLVTVAALVFVPFLAYWNLLGFQW